MLTLREITSGLRSGFRLLLLDTQAVENFDPSKQAALRSFWTFLFLVPSSVLMSWYGNRPYLAHYGTDPSVWIVCQLLASAVALPLGLWLVWQAAQWENLSPHYPRYLNAGNWLAVAGTLAGLPAFFLSTSEFLPHHERMIIGTAWYFLALAWNWFLAWRVFRCNPFYAAGLSILMPMTSTIASDFVNLKLFGVTRPFEEQWYIDLVSSAL